MLIWCLFNILCEERGGIKMNIQSSLVFLGMILAMSVYAEEYINDGLSSQVTTYILVANADNIDTSNMDEDNMDIDIDTSNMDTTGMDTSNMDTEMDESDMDTSNMD
jgi:hypothetical protein